MMRLRLRFGRKDLLGSTSEITWALTRFLLVGLGSLVLVAIPTVLLYESIAQDLALKTAMQSGRNLAVRLLAPQTTSGVLAGQKDALSRIDATARARMLDGSVAHIKIWDLTGRVVYSDESSLIGHVFKFPEAIAALSPSRPTVADVSPLNDAEGKLENQQNELVEVYSLAKALTGEQLIFESELPISLVNQAKHDLLLQIAPVALAALVVLSLAQLPSALHLAREVRRNRQSRQRLLVQTVAAADHERRRLAQGLHDDVIQDLAGVGYALSSLSEHLDAENRPAVERMGTIVRRDVELLRAMLTELYPHDLDPLSLTRSLTDLGGPLRHAGANVDIDVDDQLALDETTATLVYRVARESLHNAEKHAQAQNVDVRLRRDHSMTVLTITDDGRGFEPAAEPAIGHFGLKLIRDTVAEAGGTLLVDSHIGQGTRVELSLPVG